jgi:hypothetical protein
MLATGQTSCVQMCGTGMTDLYPLCQGQSSSHSVKKGRNSSSFIPTNAFRGKSPITGRFPNLGKCFISYQEVLRSVLKNVNH